VARGLAAARAGGPPVSAGLHPSAERVLRAVARFWEAEGIPPTVRDVQRLAGFGSPQTAHYWLVELRAEGYVRWDEGTYRSLRLTPRALEHLQLTEAR
jgi:SOS-response transcriptional repressor LexA